MRARLGSFFGSRTFLWGSVLVLLAGVVAFSTVKLAGTDGAADSTAGLNTVTDGTDFDPGETESVPKESDVPKAARVAAGEFILAAVGREDLPKAWKLAHPKLKEECDCTYEEWLTGNIPVQFYPTDSLGGAAFQVDEVTDDYVVLGVLLTPKKGSKVPQAAFFIGLRPVSNGTKTEWLVDYWAPDATPPVPQAPGSG